VSSCACAEIKGGGSKDFRERLATGGGVLPHRCQSDDLEAQLRQAEVNVAWAQHRLARP